LVRALKVGLTFARGLLNCDFQNSHFFFPSSVIY
jgi:hypothetical protein